MIKVISTERPGEKVPSVIKEAMNKGLFSLAAVLIIVVSDGCSGIHHTNESRQGIKPLLRIRVGVNKGELGRLGGISYSTS